MGLTLEQLEIMLKQEGISSEEAHDLILFARGMKGFDKILKQFGVETPEQLHDRLKIQGGNHDDPSFIFDCGRKLLPSEIPAGLKFSELGQPELFNQKVEIRTAQDVDDFLSLHHEPGFSGTGTTLKGVLQKGTALKGRLLVPITFAFDLCKHRHLISERLKGKPILFWTVLCDKEKKGKEEEYILAFCWTGSSEGEDLVPLVISLSDVASHVAWTAITKRAKQIGKI